MPGTRTIMVVTLLTIVAFWLLDTAVDMVIYERDGFAELLFRPVARELHLRLMTTGIILLAGALWQRNVSHLRRYRDSLRRSESRYRTLVETSPDCVVVHRRGKPLFANRRTLDFFGLAPEEAARAESVLDFVHPDDRALAAAHLSADASEGSPHPPFELRLLHRDGRVTEVRASVNVVSYDGQESALTFFRDISDEVDTRRDLIASRERLSLALDAARDGVWDWDLPSGRMVYNRVWADMLGLELDKVEPNRSTWQRLVHPDDRARVEALLQAHLAGDLPRFETEVRLRHARGHYIWVLDRGRVVERDEQGVPVRMTGTHRDITARKEAQIALEVRNRLAEIFLVARGAEVYDAALELLQEVTESPAGLFATLDHGGALRVAAVHHAGASLHGAPTRRHEVSELVDRVIKEERTVLHRGRTALDCCGYEVDGALVVPVMNRDVVLGIVLVAGRVDPYVAADQVLMESLTGYLAPILQSHLANEATELQLRQSQKMEAIGVLAGGIAHDFNNILQAILGFASLAREEADPESVLAHDLDRVLTATDRGRELVRRILLFSRREDQETGPVDVGHVVREVLDLLRPTIPANVRLKPELCAEECLVAADGGQIGHMLLNLATNSIHAMEEAGGSLSIRLDLLDGADHGPEIPAELQDSDLVVLTVVDTGCGMAAAVLDRLYDPFFTTKDVGKGTGLGLAVVHGIVSAHGGAIRITSSPGEGSQATVLLPRLREFRSGDAPTRIATGRILVVESDSAAAAVASSYLGREGHEVVICTDVREAVARLERTTRGFDLVVAGLSIPGGTGVEIAGAAARHGDLPVIITAGSHDHVATARDGERPVNIAAVVQKPLSTVILGRAVDRVLAGRHGDRQPSTGGITH